MEHSESTDENNKLLRLLEDKKKYEKYANEDIIFESIGSSFVLAFWVLFLTYSLFWADIREDWFGPYSNLTFGSIIATLILIIIIKITMAVLQKKQWKKFAKEAEKEIEIIIKNK